MKNVQIQIIAQSEAYYLPRFPSGNIESACRLPLNACPMDCMQAHTEMEQLHWDHVDVCMCANEQIHWEMRKYETEQCHREACVYETMRKYETEQCHPLLRKSKLSNATGKCESRNFRTDMGKCGG